MISNAGDSFKINSVACSDIVGNSVSVVSKNDLVYCLSPQQKYDLWKSLNDAKEKHEELVNYENLREVQKKNKRLREMVKEVKFSGDRTIVFFNDGTKTVVQCQEGDTFDKEKGLAVACMKKLFENTNIFNEVMRKWCNE